jgi:hypothetical protein
MTPFNPENKPHLTYSDILGPAMMITDQADADQYFAAYVVFMQTILDGEPRSDGKTAEEIAKINLGYYAGYYDHETRIRVERLFRCKHPIFGKAGSTPIDPAEAFTLGLRHGAAARKPSP